MVLKNYQQQAFQALLESPFVQHPTVVQILFAAAECSLRAVDSFGLMLPGWRLPLEFGDQKNDFTFDKSFRYRMSFLVEFTLLLRNDQVSFQEFLPHLLPVSVGDFI